MPLLYTQEPHFQFLILLKVIEHQEISREKVTQVMVTHVHMDRAGGAGALMQEFSNAVFVEHSRDTRNIIDSEKLTSGTVAVYGVENTR